ncbi:aldehyde dehydrogenase family protein [Burkholderia gladioli]|uniref:aldehyde dehydrogenase family protein n=1 Tax=Burkholderia gladioli TaxID=28095 RepID=UPI002445EEBA|nr:aldehyde dehydrogenase family protein [Burkholderia gladioli]
MELSMPYQTINPTTNELVKTYPNHTDADIEAALSAAHRLYKSAWSKGPIKPRLQVLERLADLIDARKEELARIATMEMGKLIGDARDEVWIIAEIARFYARNAERFLAPVKIDSQLGDAWVEHHPIGVLLAVEPWNFPYYQLMRVFAPAIAAGNPVLAKHASIVRTARACSRPWSTKPARRKAPGRTSSSPPARLPTSSRTIASRAPP